MPLATVVVLSASVSELFGVTFCLLGTAGCTRSLARTREDAMAFSNYWGQGMTKKAGASFVQCVPYGCCSFFLEPGLRRF